MEFAEMQTFMQIKKKKKKNVFGTKVTYLGTFRPKFEKNYCNI